MLIRQQSRYVALDLIDLDTVPSGFGLVRYLEIGSYHDKQGTWAICLYVTNGRPMRNDGIRGAQEA